MIQLGDRVRDTVSGLVGIVVAEHRYLHSCVRMSVQPPINAEGKLPEWAAFDEAQLEVVESGAVRRTGAPDTGGDAPRESRINHANPALSATSPAHPADRR